MKTKFYNQLLLLSVLLFSISCEKENNITNDELLRQKIVGTWYGLDNATRYTFYDDNRYIDTLFQSSDNNNLVNVVAGRYYIENGYLFFEDLVITFDWDLEKASAGYRYIYTYPKYKIEFNNNELNISQMQVLTSISNSNTNSIYGKWTSELAITMYNENDKLKSIKGSLISEYEFLSDTNLCNIKQRCLVGQNESIDVFDSVKYEINTNTLKLDIWGESLSVLFDENKMVWEDKARTYQKIR